VEKKQPILKMEINVGGCVHSYLLLRSIRSYASIATGSSTALLLLLLLLLPACLLARLSVRVRVCTCVCVGGRGGERIDLTDRLTD
jgi:hypothetical protein